MKSSSTSTEPLQTRFNRLGFYIFATSLAVAFISLISCKPQTHTEIQVYVDNTGARNEDILAAVQYYAYEALDIRDATEVSRKSLHIEIIPVDGGMFHRTIDIALEPAGSFLFRDDRKRKNETSRIIETELPAALQAVETTLGDTTRTFLYQALFENLGRLASTKADRKICLVFSDVVEHGKINFYDHRTNPKALLDNLDAISGQLDAAHGPCPQLESIEAVLIHVPLLQDQELFSYSRKVLEKILVQKGARFQYRSSIAAQKPRTVPISL